ncbi:MAG TPA: MotA/TolQ/ExbB proton channel family protein [Terriglobales bacterium]|jgi:biopolymer transport protein ExbB/TolQ|nr:MotA/TolQ/ExbB proton channel family protein [Terriglobales bacterium]
MTNFDFPWLFGGRESPIGLFWRVIGPFGRCAVTFLVLMLANIIVILGDRLYLYITARKQSRTFIRDTKSALHAGRFDEVIALNEKSSRSHVAIVVAASMKAFVNAPPKFTDFEAIGAAERAFHRSRMLVSADLKLGLTTLLTVASSAPFVGLVGTCFVILEAFGGSGMEASTYRAMVASRTALSLIPTTLGLLVAVLAVWCHNFLLGCVSALESEISEALLTTVRCLNANLGARKQTEEGNLAARQSIDAEAGASGAPFWEASYNRQRLLLLPMWLGGAYIIYAFARAHWS